MKRIESSLSFSKIENNNQRQQTKSLPKDLNNLNLDKVELSKIAINILASKKIIEEPQEEFFKEYSNIIVNDNHKIEKGSIEYFKEKYGKYPPEKQVFFKKGELVMCTLGAGQYADESNHPGNNADKGEKSATYIKEGQIYSKYDNSLINETNIWVMSGDGDLYINKYFPGDMATHHSYFLKQHGQGMPIACGGGISVAEGKITEINNCSGHYQPKIDQALLVAKKLYEQSVFAPNAQTYFCQYENDGSYTKQSPSVEQIAIVDSSQLLGQYSELE